MNAPGWEGISSSGEELRLEGRQRLLHGTIFGLGIVLRLVYQFHRSFIGDEVGTLMWIRSPAKYILTHFGTWLSMNYFLVAERWIWLAFGGNTLVLTVLPLVDSVLNMPLTTALALRFTNVRTSLIYTLLVAVNPYLIMIAPQIRAYSLLGIGSLLTILMYLRWRDRPGIGRGSLCAAATVLCCLAHPNGFYVVLFIGLLFLADVVRLPGFRPPWSRVGLSIGIPMILAGAVIVAAYAPLWKEMKEVQAYWTTTPPTNVGYFAAVISSYFGEGYFALLPAALLIAGTWSASQGRRKVLVLWLPVVIGMLVMALQGLDHFPWAFARFLSYGIPCLCIILAQGVEWVSEQIPESRTWIMPGVVAVVLGNGVPGLHSLFEDKAGQPWNKLGQYLDSHKSTAVVAGEFDSLDLWPFYQKGEFVLLKPGDLLGDARLPAAGPVTLFYVSASTLKLRTHAPAQRFGDIRLITYTGASSNAVLWELYQDLQATVTGRIQEGEFQYAQALVALNIFFKDSPNAARFDRYLILSAVDEPQGFQRPEKQRPEFYHGFIERLVTESSEDEVAR